MLEKQVDELRGVEAYQAWMSSLTSSWREAGMRINGDSSPAFIQILLAV